MFDEEHVVDALLQELGEFSHGERREFMIEAGFGKQSELAKDIIVLI